MSRRALGALAAAGLVAALGACATNDPATPTPSSAAAAYPVTVGSVTLPAQPVKIISLSPTTTEMLFAIGAGGQVVAVDDNSNFPANAPKTELSGFQPNAEAVAAKSPDLVVLSTDANNVVAQLTTLKIPVYVAPAAVTLDDTYKQLAELGELTGHKAEAAALSQRMKDDIAKLVKDLPKRATPLSYYYELDPTLYSVTSKTFIGSLFELAGLKNVADAADTKGSGYPQLTAESLVKSNPDLIFLADTKCCQQNLDTVKARAGWAGMTSVSKGQVIALDDDIASRWGPRVVDLIRAIVDAANKVPA
ncbi:ABC transporter substrate-binding protein [Catellatospora sp. NPDC049133]|uniref:ABC transporter substrate-binding protein n=1 Tax=Catellatospora sp. NPDC049133 TaxID=3155499 RepID=UPI00340FF672